MFSKIIASTDPISPAKVVFKQTISTLFDSVSFQSTYMTKNMVNKEGQSIGEEYAMSEDERDAFTLSLDVVASDIFEIFLKQTSGVNDAYVASAEEVSITIFDNNAYNQNVLTLVDQAMRECIVNGCLKEWFAVCSHADLFKLSNERYFMSKELLKRRLFQLKKKRAFAS